MDYNENFFLVYESLKNRGLINTYVQLAAVLNTNKAGINDIKSGKKKLTIENLASMKSSYDIINIDFIMTGQGEMLLTAPAPSGTQAVPTACPACKEKDRTIAQLNKLIEHQEKLITSLEKAPESKNPPYSQTA